MDVTMMNTSIKKTRAVFVDTSAHFALANEKDLDHQKAKTCLKKLTDESATLILSNFIIAETYTLMLRKIGRDKAIQYIKKLKETAEIIRISEEDEKRAWEIILKYGDKDFSYVDATSFSLMERLSLSEAFAFDEHFDQYGFISLPID
jgi:predicted nucleic acid-binding protein